MIKKYIVIPSLFCSSLLAAQSVYAPLNNDYYHLIDRLDIKGHYSGNIYTEIKPYLRSDIAHLADSMAKDSTKHFSKVDKRNLQYLQDDNWEWSSRENAGDRKKPLVWDIYTKRNDFYEKTVKGFNVQLNPVLYFSYGKAQDTGTKSTYINTRGFEMRGNIDDKVGFYAFLTDNQAAFPQYVDNRVAATTAVPGEGYWKGFGTNGYDFYDFNGYINFNFCKHISSQFGQDKNFIGDGYRSLLLSDNSANYVFWKVDAKVWKLEYTNIYAQMVADQLGHNTGDQFYPRKYMALHYLSYNVCKNFNIGLFESITFGNTDSITNRWFDPTYLNPMIFYKAAENGLGSADKDHLGLTWKWNFLHHFSFYGTVFIDEFNLTQIKDSNGWWGDKQALQVGLKWVDIFGIHNLDGQYEFNAVRPYCYTHFSYSKSTDYSYYSNYSNYDQALADPMGANFYENIAIIRYQPWYRWSFTGKIIYVATGLDSIGQDWGSNIMINYNKRQQDYNNFITQGYFTTILFVSFSATCQIAHNMFIDLNATVRRETSALKAYSSTDKIVSLSFRWNIGKRLQEF